MDLEVLSPIFLDQPTLPVERSVPQIVVTVYYPSLLYLLQWDLFYTQEKVRKLLDSTHYPLVKTGLK